MTTLFSPDLQWLWTIVLGLTLFWPVRNLIWVLAVRREGHKTGAAVDDERRRALKRQSSVTAALLCFVFVMIYVNWLYSVLHGR